MNALRQTTIAGALLLTLLSLTGCASWAPTDPVRAIWVTRFDYRTEADVERIMENCANAGFNTVLFQVRGNATAFYDSPYEPWPEQLDFEDPGYDPLAVACARAHDHDIELHAWVNVMPAWRGVDPPPEDVGQLYHTHPEWFWYDQYGKRQELTWFYVSLNPCLPEVREYLVEVFADIARRYEIDGLHLDYIRFPNEHPAIPRDSGIDYPRDERTLALYRDATGLAPDDDPERWNEWRTAQVTQLVADIHDMLRRTRPGAALTTAAGVVAKNALKHHQDSRAWIQQGLVDAVMHMNYTNNTTTFYSRQALWLDIEGPAALVPGLWFGKHETALESSDAVMGQIAVARDVTGHFCVFAYSALFDSTDEDLTSQDDAQRALRAERRELLLPYLKQIAEQDAVH